MKLDSSNEQYYRQFKLSNGEEILAEVMQWSDEEQACIIVRKAMRIFQVDRVDGFRMYTLRPWMIYGEDPNQLLSINDNQIVGECTPAPTLIKQYETVIQDHAESFAEELKKMAKEDKPFPHNLSDEKLKELMIDIAESEDSNVVNLSRFKIDRSKMH